MNEEHDNANSNSESSYRPSSPDLSGFINTNAPLPRLTRIPSYHAPDSNFPSGYSFSPRGSYDASPFFSPSTATSTTPSTSYFGSRPPTQSSQVNLSSHAFRTPSLPGQTSTQQSPLNQFRPSGQPYSSPPPSHHYSHRPYQIHPEQSSVPFPPYGEMPRTRQQRAAEALGQAQDYSLNAPGNAIQPKVEQVQPVQPVMPIATADPSFGIDVKTKFPVARIKRIMQADEDVGKVAQATPTAVSKALELFMITLVSKGATEARANGSKRVTAQHLKAALMKDGQFDFLNDICEAIPDEGSKKGGAKSEAKSEDSEEDIKPKGKGKGGKKRKAGTDDESD
ncbi:uncharacterized protein Z519_09378 [Cladophialophora bantiana CBS 173.52]|uniref:NCT transcriptional regulatory complex subunit A n=1 Tax=Cladophialophora bantiana (strain ATCC 10958 / CBS 173.52 / CDC B-1940 / NIH 8579) TaxID=1442370 RepID=A0A0D2H9N6_CLAB1|nr:uncharacterized protein Z519_09378 [Cladophialophora bantiana CBS 173.52]KIW89948.1 hypothetical protein Z519_09378 [Cladophialophora bantiana CBS 173.52]